MGRGGEKRKYVEIGRETTAKRKLHKGNLEPYRAIFSDPEGERMNSPLDG